MAQLSNILLEKDLDLDLNRNQIESIVAFPSADDQLPCSSHAIPPAGTPPTASDLIGPPTMVLEASNTKLHAI